MAAKYSELKEAIQRDEDARHLLKKDFLPIIEANFFAYSAIAQISLAKVCQMVKSKCQVESSSDRFGQELCRLDKAMLFAQQAVT